VLIDEPPTTDILNNVINTIHACRTVGGLAIDPVWVSERPFRARVFYSDSERALGDITGLDRVFDLAREAEQCVDALAITSEIDVSRDLCMDYYFGKPVALSFLHSPAGCDTATRATCFDEGNTWPGEVRSPQRSPNSLGRYVHASRFTDARRWRHCGETGHRGSAGSMRCSRMATCGFP
jgi:hypothetical protein